MWRGCVHRIDHVEARHHRAQVVLGGEGVVVVEEACMATAQVGVRVRVCLGLGLASRRG